MWTKTVLLILSLSALTVQASSNSSSDGQVPHGIHLASFDWSHVGIFITITLFIVLSGLAKVGKKSVTFKRFESNNQVYFCSLSPCAFHIQQSTRIMVKKRLLLTINWF